ncbi:MAG: hypothetical protein E7406_07155 [Ruminococcaceae bacterium]|nr:hypothetical protein [Oscillospiraceae bacterium]
MKKRILALIMAFAMVFAFAACSKEDKGEKKPVTKDTVVTENGPEAVVEDFMSALCALDVKPGDYEKYFVADAELEAGYEELAGEFSGLSESFMEGMGEVAEYFGAEDLDNMIDAVTEKVTSSLSYEIVDVKENNGSAEITVVVSAPDFENINTDDDAVIMEAMTQAFGFDMNDTTALMEKWMEKEGITSEAELMEKLANVTSEDEIMEMIISAFSKEFNDFIIIYMDMLLEDADTVENTFVLVVEKQGEDWKIVEMN